MKLALLRLWYEFIELETHGSYAFRGFLIGAGWMLLIVILLFS